MRRHGAFLSSTVNASFLNIAKRTQTSVASGTAGLSACPVSPIPSLSLFTNGGTGNFNETKIKFDRDNRTEIWSACCFVQSWCRRPTPRNMAVSLQVRKYRHSTWHQPHECSHKELWLSFGSEISTAFASACESTEGIMPQRVLVCVLCGSERHGWINPRLSMLLTAMATDKRYDTKFQWICDRYPVAYARNSAIDAARRGHFDALLMLDNDIAPSFSPLDLVRSDGDVITTPTAFHLEQGTRIVHQNVTCCLIRSKVWRTIPGPWFKWTTGDDELCSPANGEGEDIHFLRRCQENGIKVATASALASHYHTIDIAGIGEQR